MAELEDEFDPSTPSPPEDEESWWKEHETFAIIMLALVGAMLLLGLAMVACMIRYPSFDFAEKLGDLFEDSDSEDEDENGGGKSFNTSAGRGTTASAAGHALTTASVLMPGGGGIGGVRPITAASVATVPSLRLPTPGDAPPDNRLPPIHTVNNNAFSVGGGGGGGAGTSLPPLDGRAKKLPGSIITLQDDLESILDASRSSRRSEDEASVDSGAVLDDLQGRVGLSWNKEVASDIPSVGGGGGTELSSRVAWANSTQR